MAAWVAAHAFDLMLWVLVAVIGGMVLMVYLEAHWERVAAQTLQRKLEEIKHDVEEWL